MSASNARRDARRAFVFGEGKEYRDSVNPYNKNGTGKWHEQDVFNAEWDKLEKEEAEQRLLDAEKDANKCHHFGSREIHTGAGYNAESADWQSEFITHWCPDCGAFAQAAADFEDELDWAIPTSAQ